MTQADVDAVRRVVGDAPSPSEASARRGTPAWLIPALGLALVGFQAAGLLAQARDALHVNVALTLAQGAVYAVVDDEALLRDTAAALAAGEVVGWFQGRMEFGPRALGNRSILGDPRNPEMQLCVQRQEVQHDLKRSVERCFRSSTARNGFSPAPADSPTAVMLLGSPPKAAMFC